MALTYVLLLPPLPSLMLLLPATRSTKELSNSVVTLGARFSSSLREFASPDCCWPGVGCFCCPTLVVPLACDGFLVSSASLGESIGTPDALKLMRMSPCFANFSRLACSVALNWNTENRVFLSIEKH